MTAAAANAETLADLLERLGGISPARIRLTPPPGTATVTDLLALEKQQGRLFELVDGVLVEKIMGYRESLLAAFLIKVLAAFVDDRNLGLVSGSDGMIRLFPGLVRIPDVAFVSWARIPGGRVPTEPVPSLVPDLAIEVLSEGNTADEMARKLREYLTAGVGLVWLVDPETRTLRVHVSLEESTLFSEGETVDGGEVLPGFTLALRSLFGVLDRKRPT